MRQRNDWTVIYLPRQTREEREQHEARRAADRAIRERRAADRKPVSPDPNREDFHADC